MRQDVGRREDELANNVERENHGSVIRETLEHNLTEEETR